MTDSYLPWLLFSCLYAQSNSAVILFLSVSTFLNISLCDVVSVSLYGHLSSYSYSKAPQFNIFFLYNLCIAHQVKLVTIRDASQRYSLKLIKVIKPHNQLFDL